MPSPINELDLNSEEKEKLLLRRARQVIMRNRKASIGLLQRHLILGYNQAAKLMEQLEGNFVTAPDKNGVRHIFPTELFSPSESDQSLEQTQKERNDIMDIPATLIERMRAAQHVIVFTGAGVSLESGIPTFRDDQTGLWKRFISDDIATVAGFVRDPDLVWGWYQWRRAQVMQTIPNPAHIAIVEMARHIPKLTLITQNVDDLHERAGSSNVLHLHGSLFAFRCSSCYEPYSIPPGIPDAGEGVRITPPRCAKCGSLVRPGVVWFGDVMPHDEWEAAMHATERESCDVFICVGSSLLIYPVAELPFEAVRQGATVIQVNPHPTKLDDVAHFSLHGAAGEVLPAIVRACWQ